MDNTKWPRCSFTNHPSLNEPYPIPYELSEELFHDGLSYEPDSSDIFVCTFPKSGTTWLTNALMLMRNGGQPIDKSSSLDDKIPFLEYAGKSAVKEVKERPRILKSHVMFQMIPWNPDAKYIYVARNPKDVLVSYYYHSVGFDWTEFSDGKLEDFFDMFMAGKTDFGDYFQCVGEWLAESKHRNNIFFLLYEDLRYDFEKTFLRIAEFLEGDWKEKLLANDQFLLNKVMEHSSFSSMEKKSEQYTPKDGKLNLQLKFIRKGKVGDWRNHFNEEQSRLVDEKLKKSAMKYKGLDQLWDRYGCLQPNGSMSDNILTK